MILPIFILSCDINSKTEFLYSNPNLDEKLNNKIESIYKECNLYGDFLIGIVNEKDLVYSYKINKQILEGKSSTLNINSPIYIASHTKSFTGTLFKILEEKGLVDLDDKLPDYLPEITLDGDIDTKSIRIRQLLNHTLGFTSPLMIWKTSYLGYSKDQEIINAINSDFLYDPSHKFRYSNTGPILASMVIERVTGSSWKSEMKNRMFSPLKMYSTSCNVSDYNKSDILPSIQMINKNEVFSSGFYKQDITMNAAGGIISTMNDLAKWLRFNINREISILKNKSSFDELHKATINQNREYFTYHRFGYSLGWDLATYQSDTILTRFGSYGGISFHLSFIPSRKLGIISFSNEDGANYLPHLIANYVYNLTAKNSEVENIFKVEKEKFIDLFTRIRKQYLPLKDGILIESDENNKLLGIYINDDDWPDIVIKKHDAKYTLNWGVLSGSIYNLRDQSNNYIINFGPFRREFSVKEKNGIIDSLFSGSLKYNKKR
jgi:CubicO group peptidase (beta-lactamase class C family)